MVVAPAQPTAVRPAPIGVVILLASVGMIGMAGLFLLIRLFWR
jgi:hypothetical protein